MDRLIDVFAQRRLLAEQLLSTQVIKLTIPTLLRVLEMLIPLKVETVVECLSHESNEWDSLATQYSSKEDVALAGLPY